MFLTRRKALAVLGGGTILAAGTGIGGFAMTRTPHAALAPWEAAGTYAEPRRRALSYAVLAPNPHNRQPWLVDLSAPDTVVLHRDETRLLPETDPFERQITIGLGCFLELMTLAAAETGHAVDLDVYPEGDGGPVAVARFREGGAAPDPLFAHVMARRSCKEPFEDRPVAAASVAALSPHAAIVTDAETVAALRALTFEAHSIESHTHRTMKESVDLMRMGKAQINASPDGIDLGGPMLEGLMLAGVLTRESLLDPSSQGFQTGIDMYREIFAATPAYAVLTTADNTRRDQIEAGRRWLRLNLATTGEGLSLHPVSQALQEFEEMAECRTRAHALLAPEGHTVQMLGRLGHGPATARTPRWPMETRIRDGREDDGAVLHAVQ